MKFIFCNRVGKYSKANKTSEKLTFCQTFSADDKVRRSALEKRNAQRKNHTTTVHATPPTLLFFTIMTEEMQKIHNQSPTLRLLQ